MEAPEKVISPLAGDPRMPDRSGWVNCLNHGSYFIEGESCRAKYLIRRWRGFDWIFLMRRLDAEE
jgi:hypothetical protein